MHINIRPWRHISFGIRTKVLLVSSVLLAIPWLGYEYIWEMEKFLRQGQERTLAGTARAIATALHDRPSLFELQSGFSPSLKEDHDLYARPLALPILLDGRSDDWVQKGIETRVYANASVLESALPYDPKSLSFKLRSGLYGKYLYTLFEVTDEKVVYRSTRNPRIDEGDHLQIAIAFQNGVFNRYFISPGEPGWVNAYLIMADEKGNPVVISEPRIQGVWRDTPLGYNIELRIPLSMVGPKLGFAVADVDDATTSKITTIVGTSDTKNAPQLGNLVVPSEEIEQIIKGLSRTTSRIWVVDRHRRVLARAGSLKNMEQLSQQADKANSNTNKFWQAIETKLLHPLYSLVLRQPREDFQDDLSDASRLRSKSIDNAFNGLLATQWRLTPDYRAMIISAAHPIWIGNQVMGAVVVEETTNAILTVRNQALERLFNVFLAVFILGALTLFLYASRLSFRIRRLRNEAEQAIDAHGRIANPIVRSRAGDEIGDLSRSFSNVLEKLGQYTNYLESMATRLSHELRTPVAVVRSSLENLKIQQLPDEAKVYMERAEEGLNRLNAILTSMSEATRLEQILQKSEWEDFDLVSVLSGCIEGYKLIYPNHLFLLAVPSAPVVITGSPDLIAQMLDKLVDNAVDFSKPNTPIEVELIVTPDYLFLYIKNEGPLLPEQMQGQLFESMVSIRPPTGDTAPHLGLGLYIVRLIVEFHHGTVSVSNRLDTRGVVVTIKLVRKKGA